MLDIDKMASKEETNPAFKQAIDELEQAIAGTGIESNEGAAAQVGTLTP